MSRSYCNQCLTKMAIMQTLRTISCSLTVCNSRNRKKESCWLNILGLFLQGQREVALLLTKYLDCSLWFQGDIIQYRFLMVDCRQWKWDIYVLKPNLDRKDHLFVLLNSAILLVVHQQWAERPSIADGIRYILPAKWNEQGNLHSICCCFWQKWTSTLSTDCCRDLQKPRWRV